MFVEINEKYFNKLYIQSVETEDIVEDSEYYYNINYRLQNGEVLVESFDNSSARDSKFDEVIG